MDLNKAEGFYDGCLYRENLKKVFLLISSTATEKEGWHREHGSRAVTAELHQ